MMCDFALLMTPLLMSFVSSSFIAMDQSDFAVSRCPRSRYGYRERTVSYKRHVLIVQSSTTRWAWKKNTISSNSCLSCTSKAPILYAQAVRNRQLFVYSAHDVQQFNTYDSPPTPQASRLDSEHTRDILSEANPPHVCLVRC